jgi:hypothetical protein
MSGCKIGPDAPSTEREIQAGKVANVLIGIGAIFIAITRMIKGLVMNFLNFLRLLPTSCYFDRR